MAPQSSVIFGAARERKGSAISALNVRSQRAQDMTGQLALLLALGSSRVGFASVSCYPIPSAWEESRDHLSHSISSVVSEDSLSRVQSYSQVAGAEAKCEFKGSLRIRCCY